MKLSLLLIDLPPAAVAAAFWHSLSLQEAEQWELILCAEVPPSTHASFNFQELAQTAPERYRRIAPASTAPTLRWRQALDAARGARLLFWDARYALHPQTVSAHLALQDPDALGLGSNSLHPQQALSCWALAAQQLRLCAESRFWVPGSPTGHPARPPHFQDFALHHLSLSRRAAMQIHRSNWLGAQPPLQSSVFRDWALALELMQAGYRLQAMPEARAHALEPLNLESLYESWRSACQQDLVTFLAHYPAPWPGLQCWPRAWDAPADPDMLDLAPQRLQWLKETQHEQRVPLEPHGLHAPAFQEWQTQLQRLWLAPLCQAVQDASEGLAECSGLPFQPFCPTSAEVSELQADADVDEAIWAEWAWLKAFLNSGFFDWCRNAHALAAPRAALPLLYCSPELLELPFEGLMPDGDPAALLKPWQSVQEDAQEYTENDRGQVLQCLILASASAVSSTQDLLSCWHQLRGKFRPGSWIVFRRQAGRALQDFERFVVGSAPLLWLSGDDSVSLYLWWGAEAE